MQKLEFPTSRNQREIGKEVQKISEEEKARTNF